MSPMRLIFGLGNPGSEYHLTRHNVGFMVLDRLAQQHGLSSQRPRLRFESATLEGEDRRCSDACSSSRRPT